jgi:hypothetical protein
VIRRFRVRRHRRAAERARRDAQVRRYHQLVAAADWVISAARRHAAPDELAVVTVAAVQRQAAADWQLQVDREEAAAVLRDRLRLRGDWDIAHDAGRPGPTG